MDEYQLQVPDNLVRLKEFDTGLPQDVAKKVLKDVAKSKKLKSKGEPYKTAKEMCQEYGITMDLLKAAIDAEKDAKELETGKFLLSGNIKLINGKVCRGYSRAGQLMVEAIEEAYQQLGFRVPITGEYLIATPEEGWAGAH